jgi:ribosomal protein L19
MNLISTTSPANSSERATTSSLRRRARHTRVARATKAHPDFRGIVICRKGSGIHESSRPRMSAAKAWSASSGSYPNIDKIEVDASRPDEGRMYYLRDRIAGANKVREKRFSIRSASNPTDRSLFPAHGSPVRFFVEQDVTLRRPHTISGRKEEFPPVSAVNSPACQH